MALPFLTGTAGSGTGQYFVDQSGQPFLFRGDTAWGLILMAGASGGTATWQSDIDAYMAGRAAQGFNVTYVAAPGNTQYSNGATDTAGDTWDSVAPFTGGDPGVLNSTYWARVDYMLTSAAAQGITVMLDICPTYCINTTGGPLNGKSDAQFTAMGAALGARYAATPNLLWMFGDDSNGFWDPEFTAAYNGVRSAGAAQMASAENYFESTSRFSVWDSSVYPFGTSNAQWNFVYSYNVGYAAVEYAYGEASPLVVVHSDGTYDGEVNVVQNQRDYQRNLVWWCLTSGSRGFLYGRVAIWPWPVTALANIASNTFDNSDLKNILNAFGKLTGWNLLVPDLSSALVTAGRGTHLPQIINDGSGHYTGGTPNNYVSASKTADGQLAVMYLPNAATAITVNPAGMIPGYSAKWIDPVSGVTSVATIGATYSHAGPNSIGGTDWVLALIAPPYTTWTVP